MNQIFEDNINLLDERFPSIAEEIVSVALPTNRRSLISKSGRPAYQVEHGDKWIALTSSYDPWREAEQQVAGSDIENVRLVFVFGEAGLYHAEAALKRAGTDTKLIIISRDASYLRLVFETRDLTHLLEDDRVAWLISSEISALEQAFRKIASTDVFSVPTFSVIMHPAEINGASRYYIALQTALHTAFMTTLLNFNTAGFFEPYWTKNFVSNLPLLLFAHHLRDSRGSWKQKPVVIVGAGPSLNKNVHLLHECKGKALIICVGTAYRILEKNGIIPDVIVSIDGGPENAAHFAGSNYDGIPLLMDVYCHKDITLGHNGPKIAFSSANLHEQWWSLLTDDVPMDIFGTGGSAATTAFYFARHIDANPVIMVGEDLSYPSGARYAKGARRDNDTVDDIRQRNNRMYEVEDIFGNTVYTTGDYLYYLKMFEQEALKADRTYINATEGGALKEGYTIKTLQECLNTDCNLVQPVSDWKDALYHPYDIDEQIVRQVSANLKRSFRELKAITQFLSLIIGRCNDALQELDRSNGQAEIQKVSLLTEKMLIKVKRLRYAMAFLDACSFTTVVTDIRLSESLEINTVDDEHTIAKMRVFQSLRLFTTLQEKALESLKSHRDGIEALWRLADMKGGFTQ